MDISPVTVPERIKKIIVIHVIIELVTSKTYIYSLVILKTFFLFRQLYFGFTIQYIGERLGGGGEILKTFWKKYIFYKFWRGQICGGKIIFSYRSVLIQEFTTQEIRTPNLCHPMYCPVTIFLNNKLYI